MKSLRSSIATTLVAVLAAPILLACGDDAKPAADTATADAADSVSTDDADAQADTAGPPTFTLHFHRPDGDYAGWTAAISGDVEGGPAFEASATDGFGAVYSAPLAAGATTVTFSLTKDDSLPTVGPFTVTLADVEGTGVWYFLGAEAPLLRDPPAIPGPDQLVVHYLRDDATYAGWGLHLWKDVAAETAWTAPKAADGADDELGAYYVVDLAADAAEIGLIVHQGDTKDPGPDMTIKLAETGNIIFLLTGSTEIYTAPTPIPEFAIAGARAHWLTADTIAWTPKKDAATYELRYALDASIEVEGADVAGGTVLTLTKRPAGLTAELKARWPHLADRGALLLAAADLATVPTALRGELVVVARDADGVAVDATRVQIPGVLDDLFAYEGPLGLTFDAGAPRFALWAPTAQSVSLLRYAKADKALLGTFPMTATDGVWTYTGADATWTGDFYRFEIVVFHPITAKVETLTATDPYSVSLSLGSAHSQIVDLTDPALAPAGWAALAKPALDAPEDIVIYEGHIRDFSQSDATVPAADRGKYKAFTHTGSNGTTESAGMAHLRALAASGLTHFHILPSFDIATVNEDPSARVDLDDGFDRLCAKNPAIPTATCTAHGTTPIREVLAALDPTTGDAQEIATWMRRVDSFNWGYDPLHYNVPEGSYASNPEGTVRIVEYRQMVAALAEVGLRVVADVVYNHTNAAGTGETSVLDKVVPGYYHRLNVDTGLVETSTCCANTASEHAMMERLMIDSVVLWARTYKIDAFRFDLMGHHMVANMVKLRDRLAALTLADDGVDGSKIYLYGEGWNFGEVQNGTRGQNAVQINMAGTGIGTFNDRLRDAVRGGGPFDGADLLRANQGFGNGLYVDPNGALPVDAALLEQAKLLADHIRVGLTGGLRTFKHTDRNGATKTGFLIGYNGEPAGYTTDPQESINYVSKHDNQTLFDIIAYKAPAATPMATRVRMQNVSIDTVLLGQGIPFVHMGADLLRSKSMERDSYDSGDWFNAVDFSYATNNWNVGLPNAEKDQANWTVIGEILGDATIAPQTADITFAAGHFREMLQVRKSSPLFRLRTEADVKKRVDFYNVGTAQVPGLIVMTLSDGTCAGADLDASYDGVVVIVNAGPEAQAVELAGFSGFALHPVLASSADAVVQTAAFDDATDTFTVPAWTSAVFVAAQGGAQGDVVPCNRLN